MAVRSSKPVTLAQVRAEFGAPVGTPLHAFVRGGSWVSDNSVNNGVPTSPPISLGDLLGASAYTPMTVSAPNVYATNPTGNANYMTFPTTIEVTGGNAGKTYSFTHVSGQSFTINSPSSSQTKFTQTGTPPAATYTGTYKFTVNDGTASVSKTFTVSITVGDGRVS